MIDVKVVGHLELEVSTAGVAHLSAASGLVKIGERMYVVADDENSLGMFDLAGNRAGVLFPLFEEALPSRPEARKAAKPDFESLVRLPASATMPFGALLALGSGSRANRQRGALVELDAKGEPIAPVRRIDLASLYAPLSLRFPDLNIEGAFIDGADFCLLQRASADSPVNACIRFPCRDIDRWLTGGAAAPSCDAIQFFELGDIDGVRLCFTDGAAIAGGGWAFCAAAEDTANSYDDGRCLGSVVGLVGRAGKIAAMEQLAFACKTEGIAVVDDGKELNLLLVTDADDRSAPAMLLLANAPFGHVRDHS